MARKKREWIAECEFKRRHIEARKLATKDEIAGFWPRARSAPLEAWILCWGGMVRLLAREENRTSNLDFAEADTRITRALVAAPVELTLYPLGTEPKPVRVYPKSFHVLAEFFHVRDALLFRLAAHVDVLREKGTFEDHVLLERASTELAWQSRLVAMAACTDGPGLPDEIWAGNDVAECFEGWGWWKDVTAADLQRVHQAYVQANHLQLEVLEALVSPRRSGPRQRPSWSIFFGSLATKMQVPAERLMRDHALVSLLATVKLSQPDEDEEPVGAGAAGGR